MLFDPKWDAKVDAKPGSVKHFVAWLEAHPADETYPWMNHNECPVGRYAKSIGMDYTDLICLDGAHLIGSPQTYGEAAKRTRERLINSYSLWN